MKYLRFIMFLAIVFQGSSYGQEELKTLKGTLPNSPSRDDEIPQPVRLQWKFKPGQIYHGKIAFEIRTEADSLKNTLFSYDFSWNVQSLEDDGSAVVRLNVERGRMNRPCWCCRLRQPER